MFSINFTTVFPRKQNHIQRELDELEAAFYEWQAFSQSYEILHAELTCEALDWLAIDPRSDATQRYVMRVSEQLDKIEHEWDLLETKIMFAREIGWQLEAVL